MPNAFFGADSCHRWVQREVLIGTADCNHYNCNHILFSESRKFQSISVEGLKQFVVTVAVITVCWSYEVCLGAAQVRAQVRA